MPIRFEWPCVAAALLATALLSVPAAPAGAGHVMGPDPGVASQVVVYYFHGDQRCRTCVHIEEATEQTLRARFGKELAAKRLAWRTVNFDRDENEHVINDYKLVAQSVVLVEYRDGKEVRSKNLDKVWRLIHDDHDFEVYVRDEILAFLGAARG